MRRILCLVFLALGGCPSDPVPADPAPVCGDGVVNGDEACDFAASADTCNSDCTAGVCGDGKIDGDEDCDDGNGVDGDLCTNACALGGDVILPVCGDGEVNGAEQCDFAGPANAADSCNNDCSDGVCGDGKVDGDEACDDGSAAGGDGCADCAIEPGAGPVCGDGSVNGDEQCDFAAVGGTACNSDCTDSGCGDGTIGPDEDCDDNDIANDGCTGCVLDAPVIIPAVCGDAALNGSEACDFADVGGPACNVDCTLSSCGDDLVGPDEDCDAATASCVSCVLVVPPACGDGATNGSEACDASDPAEATACNLDCTLSVCGDGKLGPNEGCDEGADAEDDDGCSTLCQLDAPPFCGDGEITVGEACELGDANCTAVCTLFACGDGIVSGTEQCDGGAICRAAGAPGECTAILCGDGRTDAGEECDDGNLSETDGCLTTCRVPFCGDGLVGADEECEDGARCLDSCTLAASCLEQSPGSFTSNVQLRSGGGADLDGDGDDDIVVSTFVSPLELQIHESVGGVPTLRQTIAVGGQDVKQVLFADIDVDGDTDIVGVRFDGTALIFKREPGAAALGAASFAAGVATPSATDGRNSANAQLGDIDGDGDIDIVYADFDQGAHRMLLNDGAGNFVHDGVLDVLSTCNIGSSVLADLDGDGDLDVADSCFLGCRMNVFENTGGGVLVRRADPVAPRQSDGCGALVANDVDDDGDLDVLGSGGSVGDISWLRNDGGFVFARAEIAVGASHGGIANADIDGDGRLDVVVGGETGLRVLRRRITGFDVGAPLAGRATFETLVADINGDGRDDPFELSNSGNVHAFRISGGVENAAIGGACYDAGDNVVALRRQNGSFVNLLETFDVDADGIDDIVATRFFGDTFETIRVGHDDAATVTRSVTTNGDPRGVTIGDFDGDDIVDAMILNTGLNILDFHKGNGDGSFGAPSLFSFVGGPEGIGAADFDGDGLLDIVSAAGNGCVVIFNDGTPADGRGDFRDVDPFAGAGSVDIGWTRPSDMDGDGDIDIMVSTGFNGGDHRLSIVRNDGNRNFAASSVLPARGRVPFGPDLGDIDGDGDDDVVYGFGDIVGNMGFAVLRNDAGTLTEVFVAQLPTAPAQVRIADFDGDGLGDVVWAEDRGVFVAYNDGGRFTRQAELPIAAPLGDLIGLAVGDFNGDGAPDVAVVETQPEDLHLYLSR